MNSLNIYYVEDIQTDFNTVKKVLKKKFNVFPQDDKWKDELDIFYDYLVGAKTPGRIAIERLLAEYKIDVIIVDQNLRGHIGSAMEIYEYVVKNNRKIPNIRMMIFSGDAYSQHLPKSALPEKLQSLYKGPNIKEGAKILSDYIAYITGKNSIWATWRTIMDDSFPDLNS